MIVFNDFKAWVHKFWGLCKYKLPFFRWVKQAPGDNWKARGSFSSHGGLYYLWKRIVHCFRIAVLKKTLESPLDCQEFKPVNPKRNQSWIFIGRTDAEAPVLWPSDVKSQLIGKAPDAGKDWGQMEKGKTEDEMVGWHHNGHEFEQTPGDSKGQGSLAILQSMRLQRIGHDLVTEQQQHI